MTTASLLRRAACLGALLAASAALVACGEAAPPAAAPAGALPPLTQFTFDPATERDAAWSPDGQWIAFGSYRSGNEDIWKKRVDGTGEPMQLTAEPSAEIYAVWSPDGSRLAFTSDKGGSGNVWTVSAEGGQMTRITADADSVSLVEDAGSIVSWSPDGQWIAFESSRGGGDIWAITATGDRRRLVAGGPDSQFQPSWSPDGRWIAFASARSGSQDIWVVGAEGGPSRQVTTEPAVDSAPSWSPDGRWIVFQSTRSGYTHIWVIPVAGGTAVQVSGRPEVNDYVARWSPDGTRTAFNSQPAGGALWVRAAGGGQARPLGQSDLGGRGAWSPDGKEVAFVRSAVTTAAGGRDVFVVSRSGGAPRALTTGGLVERGTRFHSLDWSPAGDEIVFTRGQGALDLWAVPLEAGEPWQVTLDPGNEIFPRLSPDGRQLAYAGNPAEGSPAYDIWLIPAAGGLAERLLDWPSIEWAAAWSPDGRRLAFTSNRGRDGQTAAPWQVWTVSAAGADPQWLAEGCMPDWSPDGAEILFVRVLGGGATGPIYRIPAGGGTPELVGQEGAELVWPRWSPDGSEILFGQSGGAVADIWIADVSELMRGR
ncbi:MAG: DPP IV N-terminal domain-containing protein [Gemmatimonadota bacterium]